MEGEEEWRPVISWPGYEASSWGRIKRAIPRGQYRNPKILPGSKFSSGYIGIQTTFEGKKVTKMAHVLVCEAFHGPPPSKQHQVRHLDGSRSNNCPGNLAWGTPKENADDRRRHRRDHLGSRHPNAKLDEHDIVAIFCLARKGRTGQEIGQLFGLDRNQVNKILTRQLWKHLHVPDVLVRAAEMRNAINGNGAHPPRGHRIKI